MFCELWDNTPIRRELKQSTYNVPPSAITIIGGTTAQFLEDKNLMKNIETGFWGRFLFIPARFKEPPPSANPVPDVVLWDKLKGHLNLVKAMSGEVDFSHVESEMNQWVAEHEKRAESNGDLSPFFSRSGEYLKKLSIIAQAGLTPYISQGQLVVTPQAFKIGRMLSEWHRHELPKVFAEDMAMSWADDKMRLIRRMLNGNGGEMEHSKVLRRSHLTASQLGQIKTTMEETDEIEFYERNTGPKPVKMWKLK